MIWEKITSRTTHTSKVMGAGGPEPTLSLGKAGLIQFSWRLNNPFFVEWDDVTQLVSWAGPGLLKGLFKKKYIFIARE